MYFGESTHDYAIGIGEILFIYGWDLVFWLAISGICRLMNFLVNAHWDTHAFAILIFVTLHF
jgi:hypothetical protein